MAISKKKHDHKEKRPWWRRILKFLWRTFLFLFILFIALVLFVRSPWGQDIIVGKLTNYVSKKTNTEVSIDRLFITFSGAIVLEHLYLEDEQHDTLIYSEKLSADIPIWPIITGHPISVDGLEWKGLRANITRHDSINGFNYQFLIDAFASDSVAAEPEDSKSEPPQIFIGSVDFSDFKLNYEDEVSGMKANLNLGTFHFEGKYLDLEKMKFQVAELVLDSTTVNYTQSKVTPQSEETTESALPYLNVDELRFNNVVLNYKSDPDSIDAQVDLGELVLELPKADLDLQDIEVSLFSLQNSNVKVTLGSTEVVQTDTLNEVNEKVVNEIFKWPDWNVNVNTITLQNNDINYQAGEHLESTKGFNPDHIVLSDIVFKANNISLSKNESAKVTLEKISFHEASGLNLDQLSFSAAINPTQFLLEELLIKTGKSKINSDLTAQYATLQQLIDHPEKSSIDLNLKSFVVDLNDAFRFQPELKEDEYLRKVAKHKLTGRIKANGQLDKMNLSTFLVNWGQNTQIKTNGEFENLSDFNEFTANVNNFTLVSNRSDLTTFVSEKDLGISVSKNMLLQAQLNGKLDDFKASTQLTLPEGKIKLNAKYKQQNMLAYQVKMKVQDLNIGKVLKNPDLGKVTFEMLSSGNGNTINDLDAVLSSNFSKLELNGYDFSALELDGKLAEGDGNLKIAYLDKNLDLLVKSKIELDSVAPKIALDFNLEGADFYALKLTEKQIRAKLMMDANFEGNAEVFDFEGHFSEGIAVYDGGNHYLGNVDLITNVTRDSVSLDVNSEFLNGALRANAGIDSIIIAVQDQIAHYFEDSTSTQSSVSMDSTDKVSVDSTAIPVRLQLDMKVSKSDLITDFLVPEIRAMDTLNFKVDLNQSENKLTANLSLPYIDYAGNTLDSLYLDINSTDEYGKYKLGFNELTADPIVMNHTYFDGEFENGFINFNFNAFNGDEELYVIKTEISGTKSDFKVHLDPEELIINRKEWTVPDDNALSFYNEKIETQNFRLSRNGQMVKLISDFTSNNSNSIGVEFAQFKLANVMALFNEEDLIANGDLEGSIAAIDPFGNVGLKADFNINKLTALETALGNLSLQANSKNNNIYSIDLGIKGEDLDIALNGDYSLNNLDNELDFKLSLNKIGVKTIADLSNESLADASGNISGEISIKGSTAAPDYKGFVKFNDAIFKVNQLNSQFQLANDKIKIDNTAITLNQFSLQDEQKNKLTLNGSILTDDMTDPSFDLTIKSKNFQAMNSSIKDSEIFYGSMNFDMNGTVLGKMSAPIVDMNIEINKTTDFTYILQDSQAELEKSDGIVEFVNKKDPDNIITRTNDSTNIAVFGGVELHTRLKIAKGAHFSVIIDQKTEDQLNISGTGDLNFNIKKNGVMTLGGRYDITDGSYSLTLYNLVKRKFNLESGSSIVWRGGDPMDADLNVTAKYFVETSASALMASQISDASDEIKNRYRQKLPFLVYLNVKGSIDQPELSFNLGMPEDARGAIDGTVYGRIKQLNTEEDALNKQVFSLLVLEKFYSSSGSDGSSGGAASLVRTNINDALTDQLNAFSGKLTGNTGIELDFGLNSYTDYQGESSQQRTDLNISAQKKLFDDRLIVQVGSNVAVEGTENPGEENPIVGNVNIQYLLTEDGHWRIKGFRNSTFENVIDGQIFVNGISLIFQRQFNEFNELFNPPPKTEDSDKEEKDEDSNKEEPKKDNN